MIRPYQSQSIKEIRELFRQGYRKVLLWLATGAGKTYIFCLMVKQAVERGKRVIIVVRGRKLVDQASQRLIREGVEHGVYMGNHWNFRPHFPVQVCSIDTLIARKQFPPADLIVIDEVHMSTSKGYKEFMSHYPQAFVVGVTATPWTTKGLAHVAEKVVHPVTMLGLIDQGYLVNFRAFAPSKPNLKDVGVSSSTKDYITGQLADVMVKGKLTGKVVSHWKKLASDRPTLCFAVNIRHSKVLLEQFLEAGITAEHCDAMTPDDERDAIVKRWERGETKIICNVGIFGTGVDIPRLGCIIMARPTKSRNLYIQQAGRGTRPYDGKSDCLLLDHAGNISRHGLPTDEEPVELHGEEKETTVKESKICEQCFAVYRGKGCPECGHVPEVKKVAVLEESDEDLVEVKIDYSVKKRLKELERQQRKAGRKKAWVYHQLVAAFGLERCEPHVPQYIIDHYTDSRSTAGDHFKNSPFKPI